MSPRLVDLFLAAPTTSVASERVFSVAGDTGTATRRPNRRSTGYASFFTLQFAGFQLQLLNS